MRANVQKLNAHRETKNDASMSTDLDTQTFDGGGREGEQLGAIYAPLSEGLHKVVKRVLSQPITNLSTRDERDMR